jgi:hypothetical protein
MKKLSFLSLLLVYSFVSICQSAQNTPDIGALYKFSGPMKLSYCDENGEAIAHDPGRQSIPANSQFTIQKIVKNGIIISFAKWNAPDDDAINQEKDLTKKNKFQRNKDLNQKLYSSNDQIKYFLIQTSDLQNAVKLQHAGTVSLVTGSTFIKFRPGSSTPVIGNSAALNNVGKEYYKSTDIANDFTLSLLASLKLSAAGSNSNIFWLFGANFSSIKVTPATTQNFLTAETNVGSLAPTVGFMYQVDKVQFGLLSGIDVLTGDVNRYWVYRGRPWFAIGIGFSIVSAYGSSSDNTNK